jgi:hypothetical protein
MLQHEFEQLTGVKITPEQYEVINGMYMCDDNQTKQEFCKSFMEMGLMAHVNYVVRLKGERETLNREKYEVESQRNMWRDEYAAAKEKAAVLECRINAIAEMVKGGAE